MSFLAGRLAGKEGAYFFQESKQAVNRLAEKTPPATIKDVNLPNLTSSAQREIPAEVLPEVLRHSLPSKIFGRPPDPSSLSTASKWVLPAGQNNGSNVSPDALNPLRAYVSLPQVTFGPKRWELPNQEHSVLASTANELRRDKYTPINPEKLKAAAEGLQYVGKAFVAATVIVFGGASVIFGYTASKLEMHNTDEIRTKGKDFVQPKFDIIREQLTPIKTWAENTQKKWHLEREEDIKEKPIVKELSRILGAKTSS
ncbi:Coiled-coil domain-containing protein 21, putative isoform 2 [Melia azedarach]|uniref:Coiled-coil domain-containing protein 21, putative isoform 2 n=1 Tax=Melia azedarach TaxID=155640 RepID=A0ACC1Z272_MELAZ|nr:Coiled-coil domain-containing protein 21, putative isoform 2 [Melia azedarach]